MEENKAIPKNESKEEENDKKEPEKKQDFPASGIPRNAFDTPEYRNKIESKLKPLNIEDLIYRGRLIQTIPLTKNMSVTFSTIEAGVESLIDRIAIEHEKQDEPFYRVSMLASISAALVAINNEPLISDPPVNYDGTNGDKYLEQLRQKLTKIKGMTSSIILLLSNQLVWFQDRVNKLVKKNFIEGIENF